MQDITLIFVYGTLRRGSGHAMGEWLAAEADWWGRASCAGARLYQVSWYPALVAADATVPVIGDLYRLREPAALWPTLDAFEGVTGGSGDEYERRPGTVRDGAGRSLQAWIYWYRGAVDRLQPVPGGDWLQR